jgi:V8-like Glu-specific endopeptidase
MRESSAVTAELSTAAPSKDIEKSIQEKKALPAPKRSGGKAFQGGVEAAPVSKPGSQAERKVFGRDDRVRINLTREYPFRAIGLLQIKFPETATTGISAAAP